MERKLHRGQEPVCRARLLPRQRGQACSTNTRVLALDVPTTLIYAYNTSASTIPSRHLQPSHHGSCEGTIAHLPEPVSAQPPLIRVHQVEEDGRGELLELPQDIPRGWEGCDLENPRGELQGDLVVQWLRLRVLSAGAPGRIPGQGTKPHN